jgi:aryl-alcohol dehydrogenase-like predicted oxidoreductase
MKHRVLGRTGIRVSELGLGGVFISSVGAEREEGIRAIHRAIDLGINYLDTAPGYANSEEVLSEALKGVNAPLILSTKLGGRPQPFDARDKDALRRSVDLSLQQLGRSCLDILMIHEPDRPGLWDWFSDWDHFHGPVTELLAQLKAEKIVRFTGLGGTTAYTLPLIMATGEYDVVLTAFNYSLLWQEALVSIFPEARKQQMGIIVGSPLQQGALATMYTDQIEHGAPWLSPPRREQYRRLYALVRDLDIPLPELGLRFCLTNTEVSTVLTGARSVKEVEQNVAAAAKGPLPDDIMHRIRDIAALVPFRPFEEPFSMPFAKPYRGPGAHNYTYAAK